MLQEKGTLFVISAPSGAGKNSLLHGVLTGNDQLKLAISHTTRLPRPGESEGKSYYFIDEDVFCLLYTSDAADDMQCVDLGGRRIIKKIFFFSSRRRHTRFALVSWARRCV